MQKIINSILILLISINIIYVLSGAANYSFTSIDSYSIWLFKAKAIYVENGFPIQTLKNPNFRYSHPDYPILLPLIIAEVYKIMGKVDEGIVQLIYPFIYLSIIVFAYHVFKKLKIQTTIALLMVYVYSMLSPLLAAGGRLHPGEADIILTLIYWVCLYLVITIKKPYQLVFYLMMLSAIAAQFKQEGIFLSCLIIFLPVSKRTKLIYMTLAFIPSVLWHFYRISKGVITGYDYYLPNFVVILSKLVTILTDMIQEMLNIKNWYIFWPVFWLVMFTSRPKKDYFTNLIIQASWLMGLLFIPIYIFTNTDVHGYVSSSFDRILLQLSPLFFTIFVIKLQNLIRNSKLISPKP